MTKPVGSYRATVASSSPPGNFFRVNNSEAGNFYVGQPLRIFDNSDVLQDPGIYTVNAVGPGFPGESNVTVTPPLPINTLTGWRINQYDRTFTQYLDLYLPIGRKMCAATANGTTTTFIANAAEIAVTVSVGDRFRLCTAGDVAKENSVFTVDAVAGGTITFSPPAAVATAIGNKMYQVQVPDVTRDISDQFSRIDQVLQVIQCTSATRPVAPIRYTGCIIYETDTFEIRWWNGSSWQLFNDRQSALGCNGSMISTSPATFNGPAASATVGPGCTLTATFDSSRVYIGKFTTRVVVGTIAAATMALRQDVIVADGGTVTTAGTVLARSYLGGQRFPARGDMTRSGMFVYIPATSGVKTIGLFYARGADAAAGVPQIAASSQFYVEDVGTL